MKEVSIYTDGACSGNPGPGGWCAVLVYKGREKEISGAEKDATNNRMELMAALKGLGMLKERCKVYLYSDSSYLVNAFNEGWIERWAVNGWKKTDKSPVKNTELWKELHSLNKKHIINWIKVKGHADNEMNIRCDKKAVEQVRTINGEADDIS